MSQAPTDFERIFEALAEAGARYLVVGGVAVVLHGHPRLTADLALVVALERENAHRAVRALASLDYRPRAPVRAEDFADPAIRAQWIDEKGLTVFSLWSPHFPATDVDIFISEPMPFDPTLERAVRVWLSGVEVAVASLEDLIAMKKKVGRPKVLDDVAQLEKLLATEDAVTETARGFEDHEEAQRRAWADLSPLARLRWLQQAKEFARRWGGAASRTAVRDSPPPVVR